MFKLNHATISCHATLKPTHLCFGACSWWRLCVTIRDRKQNHGTFTACVATTNNTERDKSVIGYWKQFQSLFGFAFVLFVMGAARRKLGCSKVSSCFFPARNIFLGFILPAAHHYLNAWNRLRYDFLNGFVGATVSEHGSKVYFDDRFVKWKSARFRKSLSSRADTLKETATSIKIQDRNRVSKIHVRFAILSGRPSHRNLFARVLLRVVLFARAFLNSSYDWFTVLCAFSVIG